MSLSPQFLSLKTLSILISHHLSISFFNSVMKKANKISQIVRLMQVMQRWKAMSISKTSNSDSGGRPIPPGFLAVYIGLERCRFVIPTRFLNLPVFLSLLNQAEEEFGFQSSGGLALPCEVGFFKRLLSLLYRDEQRFGVLELDDFVKMIADVAGIDSSTTCKDDAMKKNNSVHGFCSIVGES